MATQPTYRGSFDDAFVTTHKADGSEWNPGVRAEAWINGRVQVARKLTEAEAKAVYPYAEEGWAVDPACLQPGETAYMLCYGGDWRMHLIPPPATQVEVIADN